MTTIQETKLNMNLSVRDFVEPNLALLKDLPILPENFAVLKSTITDIQLISEQQKVDKKGLAIEKGELREALIDLALDNSRKITAFAKFTGNTLLLNEVKFTTSRFSKMTDTAIRDYAQIIYNKGEANIETLSTYGISSETQKTLLEKIGSYNESISKPRVGITERSQATKKLALLFHTADTALKNMDLAIEIIRLTQKDFYNGYKTARKIVETSSGTIKLKALAIDKKNGSPVKGAIFTFAPAEESLSSNNVDGKIVKKTADKGRFNIKSMPTGIYKVLISKPGYANKSEMVTISDGDLTNMKVELERG